MSPSRPRPSGRPEPLLGHVLSHTHWDRAWYWTAEQTRVRLVDLLDDLLDLLQRDGEFRHFTLDGQLAMIVDYLVVRPERRPLLARLVRQGRLQVGPLFVLPDLFIPSGESLVRNLQQGRRQARSLGATMPVAYLPDPFGLPAQLPQVLRLFGIDGVLFARGMGEAAEALGANFWWDAPDGSRVLATHIVGGYCNLAQLGGPDSTTEDQRARRAVARVKRLADELGPHSTAGLLLLCNGCDHLPAEAEIPALLRRVNGADLGIRLVHSTATAYQRAVRRASRRRALPAFRGELRGSRYANILSGVLSSRVDLKLRLDHCERLLSRWAEPFAALAGASARGRNDRALLERAWRLLLLCQPHDDICGCSIDAVHDDDHNRMARAAQIGEAVAQRALDALAGAGEEAIHVNPHPWRVEAVLPIDGSAGDGPIQRHRGRSYRRFALGSLGMGTPMAARPAPPVTLARDKKGTTLDNGLVRLEIDRRGRLRLLDRASGLRFGPLLVPLDEGDAGDTYDFAPPAQQRVIRGLDPLVRARGRGPLWAGLSLRYAMRVPAGLSDDRRARKPARRSLPLTVDLRLCSGCPRVEVDLHLVNRVDDHRFRLLFATPLPVDEVVAGGPFALDRRPIRQPAGTDWVQPPSPTQPFQRLVALQSPAGGLLIAAPGLHEYEARGGAGGSEILLTVLRSIRWLSRDDLTTRRDHAGPALQVQGARQHGVLRLRLALLPFAGPLLGSPALRLAREHADPPLALFGAGAQAAATPSLALEPAAVSLESLVPDAQGCAIARLVNLSHEPCRARIDGPWRVEARRLGPDGRATRRLDRRRIPLRGGEIVTLRLQPLGRRPGK